MLRLFLTVLAVTPVMAQGIESWTAQEPLVTGYYFIWYIDGATHKSSHWKYYPDPQTEKVSWTWTPYYPRDTEPGAEIMGLDDPEKWPEKKIPDTGKWPDADDPNWHMAELRGLKYAGLDFIFVDIWPLADFRLGNPGVISAGIEGNDGSPCPELAALFTAWLELDRRGEAPVKLAPFIDTPGLGGNVDLRVTSENGAMELWNPFRLFYRQFFEDKALQASGSLDSITDCEGTYTPPMPVRALAAIEVEGEASVVGGAFFPRGGDDANWIACWDEQTWPEMRRRMQESFGVKFYAFGSQHVHGAEYGGWEGPQADGTRLPVNVASGALDQEAPWFAGLAQPLVRDNSIAIGSGFWKRDTDAEPTGGDPDGDGIPTYPGSWRYSEETDTVSRFERDWQQIVNNPDLMQKRLVVIETLNELIEGTGITPCKPETLRHPDGRYIDRWGDSPTQYLELCRKYSTKYKAGGD